MKRMLAWLYGPLFFGGFIGAGVWWMGSAGGSAAGLPWLFLGALGVSFLAEWGLPYEPPGTAPTGTGCATACTPWSTKA
ncbi:hypothetical protein P308_24315 [Pseudomonas piscis]|nr:hypothetical protein P308_24315 [Pseudomonas piscis]